MRKFYKDHEYDTEDPEYAAAKEQSLYAILETRIRELEADNDELHSIAEQATSRGMEALSRICELEAALREIANHGASLDSDILSVQRIARQTLEDPQGGENG